MSGKSWRKRMYNKNFVHLKTSLSDPSFTPPISVRWLQASCPSTPRAWSEPGVAESLVEKCKLSSHPMRWKGQKLTNTEGLKLVTQKSEVLHSSNWHTGQCKLVSSQTTAERLKEAGSIPRKISVLSCWRYSSIWEWSKPGAKSYNFCTSAETSRLKDRE